MAGNHNEIEKRLWDAADELRASNVALVSRSDFILLGSKHKMPYRGSAMVVRNGRHGYFYGCKRYPYCKGTRNID